MCSDFNDLLHEIKQQMKKLLVTAFLAASLATLQAMAAPTGAPPAPEQRLEQLQNELGLTDAQVAQIQTIQQAERTQMESLRSSFDTQIKAILTAEQAEKFAAMQKKRPEGGRPQGQGGDMPPPNADAGQPPAPPADGAPPQHGKADMLEKLKTDLGLSDEQASQLATIQQEQRKQMEALRADTQTQIKALLTAEQAEKFQQLKPRQRPN